MKRKPTLRSPKQKAAATYTYDNFVAAHFTLKPIDC
jgi:hypothetical protein